MSNRINDAIQEVIAREGIKYRDIAKRCGISEQTLHSTRNRKSIGRVGIDVFLAIAHGLGMTAEELYYGEDYVQQSVLSTSSDEQRMLDVYRDAPQEQRYMIDALIDAAARQMDESALKEAGNA